MTDKPKLTQAIEGLLTHEMAGGVLLVTMMVVALVWVNSPLGDWYQALWQFPVFVGGGAFAIHKPLLLWVNDGLMAVFFLLVALEIKREVLAGELASPSKMALPVVGAVGGMAVPALIYLGFTIPDSQAMRGWAIPSATDIAFSLGILSVLGRSVPVSLRVFLTALAIIDDLGAIVIIAFFYSGDLSGGFLAAGGVALAILVLLNRMGVTRLSPYFLVGLVLWVCMLKSGVHATIAGVLLGFCIPYGEGGKDSQLIKLEHALGPAVSFAILPVFALANSGLALAGVGIGAFADPIVLGITLGLFAGKQVGVFSLSWLLIRLGRAKLPDGSGWAQFYGVSVLTGIGFTMSLFIGNLAFPPEQDQSGIRLGILAGSLAAAVTGYLVLRLSASGEAGSPENR